MLKKLLHTISAERTDMRNTVLLPTFYQHQKAYEFCRKYVSGKSVLEVGCGSGSGAYMLSKFSKIYRGIDKDTIAIVEDKKRYKRKNLKYETANLETFKPRQKYDVVISLQVIEHFENVGKYLEVVKTFLKADGIFILSTPNGKTQSYNENPYHFKEFSSDELLFLLKKHFKKVFLYGLHGDSQVKKYEEARKKKVMSFLAKDIFMMRRVIPRGIRQILFDLSSFFSRKSLSVSGAPQITVRNYLINKKLTSSIDLLAVVKL